MGDRISDLPDSLLCYILSFLSTKESVATSLLSKRWKSLWRFVPTFDFDCDCDLDDCEKKEINYHFVASIVTFLQTRDSTQSFTRFSLRCDFTLCHTRICYPTNIYKLISNVVQHKLEHLELELPCTVALPPVAFSCRTLVVLKLTCTVFKSCSSVDLPSLKIMGLYYVRFLESTHLGEFLSGCPNLEDIETYAGFIEHIKAEVTFKKLPKLTRAVLDRSGFIPLEVVSNIQFLRISWMDFKNEMIEDLVSRFDNLTKLELNYESYIKNWWEVFRMLEYCPRLQHLVIVQGSFQYCFWDYENDDRKHWQHPSLVPKCILSHLKTCLVRYYDGHESDFKFFTYIMRNARALQKMVIRTCGKGITTKKRSRMIRKLSLSKRVSSTCKLLLK